MGLTCRQALACEPGTRWSGYPRPRFRGHPLLRFLPPSQPPTTMDPDTHAEGPGCPHGMKSLGKHWRPAHSGHQPGEASLGLVGTFKQLREVRRPRVRQVAAPAGTLALPSPLGLGPPLKSCDFHPAARELAGGVNCLSITRSDVRSALRPGHASVPRAGRVCKHGAFRAAGRAGAPSCAPRRVQPYRYLDE